MTAPLLLRVESTRKLRSGKHYFWMNFPFYKSNSLYEDCLWGPHCCYATAMDPWWQQQRQVLLARTLLGTLGSSFCKLWSGRAGQAPLQGQWWEEHGKWIQVKQPPPHRLCSDLPAQLLIYLLLDQWFSTKADSVPKGHLTRCGDISWGWGVLLGPEGWCPHHEVPRNVGSTESVSPALDKGGRASSAQNSVSGDAHQLCQRNRPTWKATRLHLLLPSLLRRKARYFRLRAFVFIPVPGSSVTLRWHIFPRQSPRQVPHHGPTPGPTAWDQGWLSSLRIGFIRFELIFKPASTLDTLIFHEPTVPLSHFVPDSRRNKRKYDHHGPSGGSRAESASSPCRDAITNKGRAGHTVRGSHHYTDPQDPKPTQTGVKPAGKCP